MSTPHTYTSSSMTKTYAKKLASLGFSLIACKANKAPDEGNGWQNLPVKTAEDLELINPALWGCRCGYNDVECVDVDLKVFASLPERKEWWDEYYEFLKDHIEEFEKKVVIAKTMKGGYHILYKTKVKEGNKKLAALQGMKTAIVETRGVGGQFILYGNFLTAREYHDISYITDEEREIIMSISRSYNYIEPILAEVPKKSEYKPTNETDISPWQDYNEKQSVIDLISDEFTIVRSLKKTYVIKRHGAESPHSGYVFKDSGCMYLFSTGTHYPAEKLLSPFSIYAYKNHHGDFTKAASQLYSDGYGTRHVKPIIVPEPIKKEVVDRLSFPLEVFPDEIQHYINQSRDTLGMSPDYMGCAFLWLTSLVIGNTMVMEVKPGWREIATIWIALIGKPGIGKTPSIKQMIYPLRSLNSKHQKTFQKEMMRYNEYQKLEKGERDKVEEVRKPKNNQFIVGDITMEALVDLHQANPNAIGVFKDELAGWMKDMNKYRAGSDLEFWLSSWSGDPISLNRKTSTNAFVDKPYIPVLGGIQPGVFEEFTIGLNKENGFVDRILISYPELYVGKYNKSYMDVQLIQWYSDFVVRFKTNIQAQFLVFDENEEIQPTVVKFNEESEKEWIRIHDEYTDIQNSDEENGYMKSMYPKQKSYIPRFALLLNTIWSYSAPETDPRVISKQSILSAELLSKYFVNMAKLVKTDAREKAELIKVSQAGLTAFDKFQTMYKSDPELNRTTASEMLEVSIRTIFNWIKKIEE